MCFTRGTASEYSGCTERNLQQGSGDRQSCMLRTLGHEGGRTCLRQGVLLQLAVQHDIEPNADQGPDNVQEPVKDVGKGCAVLGGGLEVISVQLPRLFIPNDGRQEVLPKIWKC